MKADSVQPINLRGEPLGKPLTVRNRTFAWDLNAFAPASFQIPAKMIAAKPVVVKLAVTFRVAPMTTDCGLVAPLKSPLQLANW